MRVLVPIVPLLLFAIVLIGCSSGDSVDEISAREVVMNVSGMT